MAKSENNVLTHGLSGKIGDLLVFRNVNGKTIVSKAPAKSSKAPSEKQMEHRENFQEAVIYGNSVRLTPELKALYESSLQEGQTLYRVALADFMKAPKIKEVNMDEYTGLKGSRIVIRAIDDFMVKEVVVAIYATDATLVEQGFAAKHINGLDWIYTATQNNQVGAKIVITASDIPGNHTVSQIDMAIGTENQPPMPPSKN